MESDLMASLYQRGLQHVVEAIFGYLACGCLRRAALVSDVWQEMVSDERLWRALHARNMRIFPRWKATFAALVAVKHKGLTLREDDLPNSYRQSCILVDDELQALESNWTTMTYSECCTDFGPLCRSPHLYDEDYFDMNGSWLVRVYQKEQRVKVFNRWSLEIVGVLEIPVDQIRFSSRVPIVNAVKVNDSYIVVSFYHHPEICVWDTATRVLLCVIAADDLAIEARERHYGDFKLSLAYGPQLWHNLLLTCYTVPMNEPPGYSNWIRTLRRLPARVGEAATLLHKAPITSFPGFLCGHFLDNTYTVFCFMQYLTPSATFTAEIHNTTSFEITNNIRFDAENCPRGLHYSSGLLATRRLTSFSVWDVGTGERIVEMEQREILASIRLVERKYIVSCDSSCQIRIWDLQSAMQVKGGPNAVQLLKTIPSLPCPFPHSRCAAALAADEFQIAVVAQCGANSYVLLLKNFLAAAK